MTLGSYEGNIFIIYNDNTYLKTSGMVGEELYPSLKVYKANNNALQLYVAGITNSHGGSETHPMNENIYYIKKVNSLKASFYCSKLFF